MGWLSGWSYRRAVTITNNTSTELTDYQVRIELNSSNFDFSKANADGSDIRFTKDDGETLLAYWIEKWDSPNEEAIIWVKVPSIPANGDVTIYMYYGNPSATSESNAEAVFDLYDDFEDNDISDWIIDSGSFTVSGGIVESTTEGASLMHKDVTISHGVVLETAVKPGSLGDPGIIFAMQDVNNFYMARINAAQDEIQLYKKEAGSFSKVASKGVSIDSLWYAIKTIWKNDGTVRVEVYGGTSDRIGFDYESLTLVGTLDYTTSTTWDSGYVGLRSYYPSSWDWVRVRKYAEQEPTASVGSEETPPIRIKVWDGSSWVDVKAVKVWDGSAWVDAKAIYYWDGSQWVKL